MEKLTSSFTISALADFLKNAISSFKNEEEDLNHIFEGKKFMSSIAKSNLETNTSDSNDDSSSDENEED